LRECAVTRKIHRLSFARIVAMLALIGWLAGCGFKGPLYLPPPKPKATKPASAAEAPATMTSPSTSVQAIPVPDPE
jgi:predicted small lipoprotein YifL